MKFVSLFTAAFGRFLTALLLLIFSAVTPFTPVLEAWAVKAKNCDCCEQGSGHACHRTRHSGPAGPAWRNSATCASGCQLPQGAIPSPDRLAVLADSSLPFAVFPLAKHAHLRKIACVPSELASLSLRQRPPPAV